MLKGRKSSNTYLATIRRHRWGAQMTTKKDNCNSALLDNLGHGTENNSLQG